MPDRRKLFRGIPVSAGVVLGTARVVASGEFSVTESHVAPAKVATEIRALENAVSATVKEIGQLRDVASRKMGGPLAKIFDAQLMIAGDIEFLNQVKKQITERRSNAAFVYSSMVQKAIVPLKDSPDQYIRQMALDVEAVANKILGYLAGEQHYDDTPLQPHSILVGRVFSPAEILSYRNRKAVGFVSGEGGKNSHMGLISRSLMLPVVVVDKHWSQIPDGSRLIVDGSEGLVIVHPTEHEWQEYQKTKRKTGPAVYARLRKLTDLPVRTADNKVVTIAANLEIPGPVDDTLAELKLPVGLYRTEFLYLQEGDFPDEDSQTKHYSSIAETFADSYVVLRTFDLGSDKLPAGSVNTHEANPALGWRGIRCMLDLPEIFKTQIRAILRSSTRKNLRILLPMISDMGELERARKLISQCMLELKREREPFDKEIKIGIMIEVPSAALTVEQMLPMADFVAIGTNDLTQYTLSSDRNNLMVANLYNPMHPSVLWLVKHTTDACLRHRIPVCLCGESAGDAASLPLFLGMGIREFSMNPTKIFDVSRLMRKINTDVARALVPPALSSGSAASVARKLQSFRNALDKRER